ncbi:MAG TPA: type II secretion system F family protein, partial [Bryobacteraceae bacterium]|nr:type II secretion system F family protein [Bryobacteraceae bacterium]
MTGAIVFFVLAFATVAAIVWTGWQLFTEEENPLEDRLDELQAINIGTQVRRSRRRAGGGFLNSLLYLISLVPGGDEWLRDTERELQQAGVRSRMVIALYSIGNVAFLLLCVLGMLYLQRDNPLSSKIGGLAAALILGWLLPRQILYRLVRRYKERLNQALPDTIDLLGIVLGTGLALDQAFLRVSEEMQHIYPEIAGEFYTVVMQVKAGQERSRAFQSLVRRTGIEDIKSLAAMIVQSERFGTSLSQALKVYAEALRTKRRLRAEAAVGKAGLKITFAVVLFILPALFVVALVPGVLSALRDLR